MPDMIWQVGHSADEQACAHGLAAKNGAQLVTTANLTSFEALTARDRLQIVADFALLQSTASNMTARQMAEFLVAFGLRQANHISLVICNSGIPLHSLGGLSFAEALRRELIAAAVNEPCSLYVAAITGRKGYVNVYNEVLRSSELDAVVRHHFANSTRTPVVGRKYVHTEPTMRSPENEFLPKGHNKAATAGIAVEEGVVVA